MKRVITAAICLMMASASMALETKFFSVDFGKKTLTHDGKTYELVEVKNKVRKNWREVTYLCIDPDLKAVAFRLFVTDEGDFLRLQKYTSKK